MSSNFLHLSSVWKSLVVSCVYVAEVRTPAFNAFVSYAKHVHLQRQKCSSLVQ